MADPDFLFHKNDLFNVAICKKCQYGVISSRIAHHILDKHETETEESAKHIAEIVSTWNVRNDRNITYSNNAIDQQEYLPLHRDGLKCNECKYISRHLSDMRAHCRDQHKWNPYESNTGSLVNGPWREHVYCQKLFPKRHLFEVEADAVSEDLLQQAATDPDFLFHKNELFNVAICKKCQYGVLSTSIRSHIRNNHANETEESALNIAEIVSTWNVRNDKSISFSNNAIDQQEYLPLHRDGLKCNECKYIFRLLCDMRAHCRDQHKWNPYESNTGSLVNGPWREHVYCQKLFPKGHLFEVEADAVNEDLLQQAATDPDFLFHKNELFNVAICKKCQYGVISTSISRHVYERHANENEESAINIAEIVSTWNVRNDKSISFSNNAIDQQEYLALYHDGLACKQCGYVCRDVNRMRKHRKDEHGWISSNGEESQNGPVIQWRENVLCQQMFGSRSKYFEVRPKVAVAPDLPQKSSDASMPSSPADASSDMTEDNDDLAQKVWDSTISTLTKAYRLGIHLREQSLLLNLNETEDRFVTEEHTFEELTTCFASLMVFFVRARNVRFTSRQLADWNNYKRLVKNYEQDHKDVEEACTRFCISLLDDQRTGNSETTLVKAMTFNGEPELIVLLGWLKGARWMVLNFVSLPVDKIKEVYPIVFTTRPQELLEIFTKRFVSSATPMRWLLDQIETIGRF